MATTMIRMVAVMRMVVTIVVATTEAMSRIFQKQSVDWMFRPNTTMMMTRKAATAAAEAAVEAVLVAA